MLFTIGVETPKNENEAFGLCVPALFNEIYSCFRAADTIEEIVPMVTDAIHTLLEMMVEGDFDISQIKDLAFLHYKRARRFSILR